MRAQLQFLHLINEFSYIFTINVVSLRTCKNIAIHCIFKTTLKAVLHKCFRFFLKKPFKNFVYSIIYVIQLNANIS